jgi:[ribosomal protein S18]-alanine N-acetyltransferase
MGSLVGSRRQVFVEKCLLKVPNTNPVFPMHYHLFEHSDFDELYTIEEVCFAPPQRFTRRYMRDLIASSDSATWIAENRGRMAGFAILEWTQQAAGVIAYIATIEVLPEWRGRGIGAELLRRLEGSANAERAVAIWLHVDAENADAIRLYERLGYRNTGRAEDYYARNRPAAIYSKSLTP